MSGPDTLGQAFDAPLPALALNAFIVSVRDYRPGGASGVWYDLMLVLIVT